MVTRYDLILVLLTASMALGASPGTTPAKPGRGYSYQRHDLPEGPWSFHVVRMDRSNPNLELHTTLGTAGHLGLATLSEQMKTFEKGAGRPLAAVNGDYYRDEGDYEGDPKGLQIMRGEIVSAPCGWSAFWIDAAGQFQMTNVNSEFSVTFPNGSKVPIGLNEERTKESAVVYTSVMGPSTLTSDGRDIILERNGTNNWLPLRPGETFSARVKEIHEGGDAPVTPDTLVLSIGPQIAAGEIEKSSIIQISMDTNPSLKGATTAIGGGPALLRDGKILPRDEIKVRNPRSAIGWNKDNFYLVQVDGRQLNVSVGTTTEELSRFMLKLGCTDAMSLDGGGSATCWVMGQVMNRPSEGFERKMANSIVLVQKPKK